MSETARIDELEIKVAHQEMTIAELNDVISAQWRKIEELERLLKNLLEDVQNIIPGATAPSHHHRIIERECDNGRQSALGRCLYAKASR